MVYFVFLFEGLYEARSFGREEAENKLRRKRHLHVSLTHSMHRIFLSSLTSHNHIHITNLLLTNHFFSI